MIRFDGKAVSAQDLTHIKQRLRHRGEVSGQIIDQGALLAFGNTIESNNAAGIYAVVHTDFPNPSINQLFISSFLQNGLSSFNELNADFALTLWDTRQQALVCARDILGVMPFYYVHQPGRFFAFATEIKALIGLAGIVVTPNRHKFREYLTWSTTYTPYSSETFYENIYSLLPGHFLEVNVEKVHLAPYWNPNLGKFSQISRPEEYSTLFKEHFTAAIDARIKGKMSIGAHLSGGLDSSSVSCIAQSLLTQQKRPSLHTFNIDTGLASTDESTFVEAVVKQYHTQHHTVHPTADVLDAVLKINQLFDRPDHFIIPSSFHLSVSIKAKQLGCDCLLTGHDGDSVITTGLEYLDYLIDTSDWQELRLACLQYISYTERNLAFLGNNNGDLSTHSKYEKYALHIIGGNITKRFRSHPFSTFLKALSITKQALRISTSAIIAYCIQRVKAKIVHQNLLDNAFSVEFKQQIPARVLQSTEALSASISSEFNVSTNQILNTTNVICNEQLNHIGAYYGHQYTFPFFDKNVVELGLSTPAKISFDHGRGRGLIRNGLQTILPSQIVSRLTKANFVEYGTISAQQLYLAAHQQFKSPSHAIWEVIDRTLFLKIVNVVFEHRVPMQRKTRYNWLLSRIIYLALWLDSAKNAR
ncbi:asparagine synthase (plasmid) [Runella rosea]|uniref:asparagine synthase (glutamine-hydrolyzing) n=2 Tax=Runella rosea TaxID=2259595 RepID=A0A344TTD8_9BACT|nr:asparagine synthase [Runella rosea]